MPTLNTLFVTLSLSFKLINYLVCSQKTFYILEEYKNKDFSIFEIDSLLVNNNIECLSKCSLKQPCVLIKHYKSECFLYGDESINLDKFLNRFHF